jgi:arylsulfatase A-like enzyme
MTQTHFLVFITDQHRADWLGCSGHPVVKTPHIDSLAQRGVRFSNFNVASPVCMPNRASLFTGRYPSVHGLRYNGCVLPQSANTFVDVLRQGGYATATIGKSHLQPFTDREATSFKDFEAGAIDEAWKPDASDYGQEAPDRYTSVDRYAFRTPYYGFDHVDMVTAHGDRAGGHYQQWFRAQAPNWRELLDPANQLPHDYTCHQAYRTPIPEALYHTSYIGNQAADWLRQQANSEQPFFLFVSFPDPHHPFNPPGKYWDMYDPADFTVDIPYRAHTNPPPPLQYTREQFEQGLLPATPQIAFMAEDRHIQEAMALSAGMITMVDDAIGGVLEALKQSDKYEDTVVLFTSDHGDYMGDSNLMLKGAWARPAINRVPFIWADPKAPGGLEDTALSSTLDIGPTILDRAGMRPYFGIQGRSLLPQLNGDPGRDELLIEFNDSGYRLGFSSPARVRTLLTERWQLSVYHGQSWGELYDRHADPQQVHNVWEVADYHPIRSELMERLIHQVMGTMDESPRANRQA